MDNPGDSVHKKDMTDKARVGRLGEDAACAFLQKAGFTIVERNFWRKWGEIDVVAKKGNELRFVEVKAVTRQTLGNPAAKAGDYEPEDNLHPWKRKRLRRAIETWLLAHPEADDWEWQVDALAVYLNPQGAVLRTDWLEDILL